MRLDMAVDGERNRVVEVDTVALPVGPDNPHGNAFTIRETVLETEQNAQRNVDFNAARFWKIESAEARNGLGRPTAYKLLPLSPVPTFSDPQSMVARRADLHDAAALGHGLSSRRDLCGRPLSQPEQRRRRAAGLDCRGSAAGRYGYRRLAQLSACTIFRAPRISRFSR